MEVSRSPYQKPIIASTVQKTSKRLEDSKQTDIAEARLWTETKDLAAKIQQ